MDNYIGISYSSTIEHFGMKWGVRTRYLGNRLHNYSTYKKEYKRIKSEYRSRKPTLTLLSV